MKGHNDMHEDSITGDVTGGTYTITNERGETSNPIPYDAPAGYERERRRLRQSATVMRAARTPEFREAIGNPREVTIIPVLPDDTVTYVLDRLAEAEYPAVLVLPGDDGIRVVKLTEVTL